MLQKLQHVCHRARSRVLMLYRIRNGLVAIPAAAYLEPVPICTSRFETRYVQIRCNTGTYSQTLFPSTIRLWNNMPVDICQLSPDSFKTPSQQLPSYLITGLRAVFNIYTALFLSKLLFIVCCTAFSLHICLFTRGAILFGIESAPLSEDEDEGCHCTVRLF